MALELEELAAPGPVEFVAVAGEFGAAGSVAELLADDPVAAWFFIVSQAASRAAIPAVTARVLNIDGAIVVSL